MPMSNPIPVTGTPCFSASMCLNCYRMAERQLAVKTGPLPQTLRTEREKERHNHSEREELNTIKEWTQNSLFIRIRGWKKCLLRSLPSFEWVKDSNFYDTKLWVTQNREALTRRNKCIKKQSLTSMALYASIKRLRPLMLQYMQPIVK